jgi:hypothetical protein
MERLQALATWWVAQLNVLHDSREESDRSLSNGLHQGISSRYSIFTLGLSSEEIEDA